MFSPAGELLAPAEAQTFFAETLPGYIRHFPWFGRAFARLLFGLAAPEILSDPEKAARLHPVFEINAAAAPEG